MTSIDEIVERLRWSAASTEVSDDLRAYGKLLDEAADALLSALSRSRRMEEALRHMLGAIDGNTIDSEEIAGDYDSGIPPHKWHEQWAYYARAALEDT